MPKRIIWSANRPQRPDVDPMLSDLRQLLANDPRTFHQQADLSGLAPGTLRKIVDGTTRRPMGTTIQMAYAMLGYHLKPVKTKKADVIPLKKGRA
ncbi:hypothetical protein EVB27_096 [Rhizobium phage RHph_TM16]|nr:hypothetical protein EVB27_096 [Rhizobium phage RHph_TM16]